GQRIRKLSQVDGGVFFIQDGIPEIVHTKDYTPHDGITTAFQCRPRLVHKGHIIDRLKHQIAKRTFIAITRDKKIIVGVTENSMAYAKDLATILALDTDAGGLGCEYALNLDGGSSSQLFIDYKGYTKEISGSVSVPNAITVSSKKPSPGYSCADQ
ncbi:MAG TPA: phosphodiester glycosidase family protein, partial [Spirochaetes bacterium]|nr:phosphodiester glycosidase family protein [Spirochaetota bacterium]